MSTNILLTGGRAPVTLELARLLTQAGHRIFVAESLKYHLCRYSRAVIKSLDVPSPRFHPAEYIQALIEIVQQEKINLIIPTCEEIFYISAGLSQLKAYCSVFVEPLNKLNILHHKYQFIRLAEEIGLLTPKTWLIQSQEDFQDFLKLPTPDKVVFKPVYSRFGSHVHILTKQSGGKIPTLSIDPDKAWVGQEFITGQHYCSYSIVHGGKITAMAVYPTIFTAGRSACTYFEAIKHQAIDEWVKTFVNHLQFTGQIAFDFIVNAEGNLYPLECNPRAISGIHLFTDMDQLDQAFFNRTNQIIQPQSSQNSMLAMGMIIYGLFPAIGSRKFGYWWRKFISGKDVIWRLSDPFPFLYLWVVLAQFWVISYRDKISLEEASTQDIEWDGEKISGIN